MAGRLLSTDAEPYDLIMDPKYNLPAMAEVLMSRHKRPSIHELMQLTNQTPSSTPC